MTPAAVHRGDAPRITAERAKTLTIAFNQHQQRFKDCVPLPPRMPDNVYINPQSPLPPAITTDTETH